MTWHVYYLGIYIAQFAYGEHAQDFKTYNRNCTIVKCEQLGEGEVFMDRFTTTEIGFILHHKTGMWL